MFAGVSVYAKTEPPTIQINGVDVISDANYVKSGVAMVDVDAYLHLLKKSYSINKSKTKISVNGKKVSVKKHKGKLVADLKKLVHATNGEKVTHFKHDNLYYVFDVPDGVVQLTPVVPKMGSHWAKPEDMPTGPIYGEYKGKLVFLEEMPSQEFFKNGESIVNLDGMKGLPSPGIDHTNIEFQAHGHEGFEVPHYDIHHYFISQVGS